MRPTRTLVADIYGESRIHNQPAITEDIGRPRIGHTQVEADYYIRGQLDREGISPTLESAGVRPATRFSTWERGRSPATSGWYHGGFLARGFGDAGDASHDHAAAVGLTAQFQ